MIGCNHFSKLNCGTLIMKFMSFPMPYGTVCIALSFLEVVAIVFAPAISTTAFIVAYSWHW